ncbi:hypothetical protein [Aulosira sp. FACHB-615]|uniref:hypothetical protein n=1 Tax=Aulosira sp. FACHB-615 TaxID=2692777 RepID=UPI001681CE86|nr:hypothetical protein [Aulosira sp. FACHB-615]MBD2487169.1 hypothetical protein [Aulosira sp. FACHB-615]
MSILLAPPSFWSEPRDPEAWLRALAILAKSETTIFSGYWSTWEQHLTNTLSRRSTPGLFGLDSTSKPAKILGVGFLEQIPASKHWKLSDEAQLLLNLWRDNDTQKTLEALAVHLLKWSVWLRILLLHLTLGDWQLIHWQKPIQVNSTSPNWTKDIENASLGAWLTSSSSPLLQKKQSINTRFKSNNSYNLDIKITQNKLSLTSLKAPLYLLDSMGWLRNGQLILPSYLAQQPEIAILSPFTNSPSTQLQSATSTYADIRGFSPVEPVMRSLAKKTAIAPALETGSSFEKWMDELLGAALTKGAIELHAAEPGQARHGRGLFGDRQRKLVNWSIHPEFDTLFQAFKPD